MKLDIGNDRTVAVFIPSFLNEEVRNDIAIRTLEINDDVDAVIIVDEDGLDKLFKLDAIEGGEKMN
jgi:hypothetical protein